jgi:hypothetical protein
VQRDVRQDGGERRRFTAPLTERQTLALVRVDDVAALLLERGGHAESAENLGPRCRSPAEGLWTAYALQLFRDVLGVKPVIWGMTFLLPQLGHVTFALVRSVMLRVISKPFLHFSHMYSYLGIGSLLLTLIGQRCSFRLRLLRIPAIVIAQSGRS